LRTGAGENIWTEEGESGGRLEKTELHNLYDLLDIIRVIKSRG